LPQLTHDCADGGFDENHVMVALSLSVLVVPANPHALARQAHRDSFEADAWLAEDEAGNRHSQLS
jgi:hypothetical protein